MSELRRTGSEDQTGFTPDETPEPDGVTCRGCDHFILDASNEGSHKHQGWWWCDDCYYALPEVIEALADIAARGDYE